MKTLEIVCKLKEGRNVAELNVLLYSMVLALFIDSACL